MKINGENLELNELKFMDYLTQRGLDAKFVALELNGQIISEDDFESVVFQRGDEAEVVCFVGGG